MFISICSCLWGFILCESFSYKVLAKACVVEHWFTHACSGCLLQRKCELDLSLLSCSLLLELFASKTMLHVTIFTAWKTGITARRWPSGYHTCNSIRITRCSHIWRRDQYTSSISLASQCSRELQSFFHNSWNTLATYFALCCDFPALFLKTTFCDDKMRRTW